MFRSILCTVACGLLMSPLSAQFPGMQMPVGERISAGEVVERVEKADVLTYGGKPFHAVMDIREEAGDPAYQGRIELFWISGKKYRLILTSPDFDQTLILDGSQVQETDRGDFYPGWLRGFVTALLDPVPRAKDFTAGNQQMMIGQHMRSCLQHGDRPAASTMR